MSIWIGILAVGAFPFDSRSQSLTEYQVKAGVLFHFAQFVDWRSDAFSSNNAPLVVGIIGADPFGRDIESVLSGKSANGHPMQLRRLSVNQDLRACHILFIASSERGRLPKIIASLNGASVLTVAETDDFIQFGIIRLVTEGGRVRFDVNAGRAERAGLRISSKMLLLARAVVR